MKRTHFVCCVDGCIEPHDAKGYCHQHYKRWKLHGDPLIVKRAPNGSGWIQRGYRYITINGIRILEHIAVAERALGKKLPKDCVVHHVDENTINNKSNNLVICQNEKYHNLLHVRLRAYETCGHPDWRKCPYCGHYDDPQNMRGEKSGRFVHRTCSAHARHLALMKRKQANV